MRVVGRGGGWGARASGRPRETPRGLRGAGPRGRGRSRVQSEAVLTLGRSLAARATSERAATAHTGDSGVHRRQTTTVHSGAVCPVTAPPGHRWDMHA